MPKPAEGFPTGKSEVFDTSLGWRYPNPKLAALFPLEQMGETAENVAEQWKISRAEQDAFALASHRKAVAAQKAGRFAAELVPVEIAQREGRRRSSSTADEGPRARHHAGEAGRAEARVPRGRHRHRGQLLDAQRRRGGGAADERPRR